jgi:hypothetical protein
MPTHKFHLGQSVELNIGNFYGNKNRARNATSMSDSLGLLVILVIVAVVLAACQPERFSQCDPTNTPGANCYRPARPLPNQ